MFTNPVKKLIKGLFFSSTLIGLVFMSACGGGGGETPQGQTGNVSGPGEGTTQTGTYLAYSSSIYLVDPANPTSPITISTNKILYIEFLLSVDSFDSNTRNYTNLYRHSLYWIEDNDGNPDNGGIVKMISLVKSSSQPSPKQLSNISNACEFEYSEDDAINKKKFMVVKTAGQDNQCGTQDDEKVLIHSGMTNTSNPINMSGKIILSGIDGGVSNPGITGFLIFDKNAGKIQKCDTNLSNCSDILTGIGIAEDFASNPNNGNTYVCIDGSLYVFDGTSISNIGANCSSIWDRENDDKAIYAIDNNGNVIKLNHGTNSWATIYNGGDATSIVGMTNNYLLVEVQTNISQELKAIKKDGSLTVNIDTNYFYGFATTNAFFYNKSVYDPNTNITTYYACIWNEGSNQPSCTQNSMWSGFSWAVNGEVTIFGGSFLTIYRLLKTEGGNLYAVDPNDPNAKVNLGQIPSGFTLFGFGVGDDILLTGWNDNDKQSDVFFVNLSTENSLINITNTRNKNEKAIF